MRPEPGQVLHFSEDATITRFMPGVTSPYVWAVDWRNAPSYWFPRQCPRAMAWVRDTTTEADRDRIIGAGCGQRVHAIEYAWLKAMQTTMVYAYRLPAGPFHHVSSPDAEPHALVATSPVTPLGPPEPVGDLIDCHAAAGIQLRLLDNLWSFWDEVIDSTVGFSGIRLRNAQPRPSGERQPGPSGAGRPGPSGAGQPGPLGAGRPRPLGAGRAGPSAEGQPQAEQSA